MAPSSTIHQTRSPPRCGRRVVAATLQRQVDDQDKGQHRAGEDRTEALAVAGELREKDLPVEHSPRLCGTRTVTGRSHGIDLYARSASILTPLSAWLGGIRIERHAQDFRRSRTRCPGSARCRGSAGCASGELRG